MSGLRIDRQGKLILSEAEVESQVIGRLSADGWTCLRFDCGWDPVKQRMYGEVGGCDWILLRRSLYVGRPHLTFLELKKPDASPEPHQLAWMDGMRKRGFHCDYCDGYDTGKRPLLSIYRNGQFLLTGAPPPEVA